MILALDTSTSFGGVALVDKDKLVAESILNVKKTHSERLMGSLERLMDEADVDFDKIEAIACGVGPGSFTGVRIAVSAAKCLAYVRGVPLVAVCTLDALAFSSQYKTVAMIDARHERAFSGTFIPKASPGEMELCGEYSLDSVKKIAEEAVSGEDKVLFLGDGATSYKDLIKSVAGDKAIFAHSGLSHIRPANIGFLGSILFERGTVSDAQSLVPFYLRESEPEIKLKELK